MVGVKDFAPKGETVKVKKEYLQDLHGKSYITHPGLLDAVHQLGIKSVATEIVSYGGVGSEAVVKATVELESGATFTGLGDASPENVSRNIATATLRMAETRALNRCYREAANLGHTSAEEMPGDAPAALPPKRRTEAATQGAQHKGGGPMPRRDRRCPDCNEPMWDNCERRAAGWKGPAWKCSGNGDHVFWEAADYLGPQDMPDLATPEPKPPTPVPDFDEDVPF